MMAGLIVSFFDQFPAYNGQSIEIRGTDGYFKVTDLDAAMPGNKRFNNWTRTKFAQEVISEISSLTGIPADYSDLSSQESTEVTPLIDYKRGGTTGVFIHPYLVSAYCLQDAKLYARVSIWMGNLIHSGTVNPHVLEWTKEEYLRGIQYNRDDIKDMWG